MLQDGVSVMNLFSASFCCQRSEEDIEKSVIPDRIFKVVSLESAAAVFSTKYADLVGK